MGLFDRFTTISAEDVLKEHGQWLALAESEEIEFSAKTVRDFLIFTNKRVFVTDTQGVFNKKTEYQSLPYRSISRWSVESKGSGWGAGVDLKLWISSQVEPTIDLELGKDESGRQIAMVLATMAL